MEHLFAAEFENLTLGFTAIGATIDGLKLNGVRLTGNDWRFATLNDPLFLATSDLKKGLVTTIENSNFDGAILEQPQFHATVIAKSSFVGAKLSYPLFFKGTVIYDSDFSLANFGKFASTYEGFELVTWRNTKLDFTLLDLVDSSKYRFEKMKNDLGDGDVIVARVTRARSPLNKIGPLWVAGGSVSQPASTSLNAVFNNYWLLQSKGSSDGAESEIALDNNFMQSAVQRCESIMGVVNCWSFSAILQARANGTMCYFCEKYPLYLSDDLAATLFTAATLSSPTDTAKLFYANAKQERKTFMRCLKDKHGEPRVLD